MVYKNTRTSLSIALAWVLFYGMGLAAANCGSAIMDRCSLAGMNSLFASDAEVHCQVSLSRHQNNRNFESDGHYFLPDSNKASACCRANPCNGFAYSVYMDPSLSPSLCPQPKETARIDHFKHGNRALNKDCRTIINQTTPIYLLTKTIIC